VPVGGTRRQDSGVGGAEIQGHLKVRYRPDEDGILRAERFRTRFQPGQVVRPSADEDDAGRWAQACAGFEQVVCAL